MSVNLRIMSVGFLGEESVFSVSSVNLCLQLMVNSGILAGCLHYFYLSSCSWSVRMTEGGWKMSILVDELGRMVSEIFLVGRGMEYPF